MGTEGSRGGSDKRPGSGPAEIEKLPRSVCRACRMAGVSGMIVDGQCVNVVACRKRAAKLPPPPKPVPPSPPPPPKDKRPKVPAQK